METMIGQVRKEFSSIDINNVDNSGGLLDLINKLCLLTPYENNNALFYNELYRHHLFDDSFAFFGHDLGGCFFINIVDFSIGYLFEEDNLFSFKYCNSGLNDFIFFHNLFICLVLRKINIENETWGECIDMLGKLFSDVDNKAMLDDNSFWSMRLYELSEDFFPLDDSRVRFYLSLESKVEKS